MRSSICDDAIAEYATAHSDAPDEVLTSLIQQTSEATGGWAAMQIGADQGAFMTSLVATLRPTFALEVGTFTGYSSICIARGLGEGGTLLCCDVSEEWTSIARSHWERAGLEDRIDLQIAPALDTLTSLPTDEHIDFAFIDADKSNYMAYFDEIFPRLSPDGIILVDNTLWSGAVLEGSGASDADTIALREFNQRMMDDERVSVALLTIGDGLSMLRRAS